MKSIRIKKKLKGKLQIGAVWVPSGKIFMETPFGIKNMILNNIPCPKISKVFWFFFRVIFNMGYLIINKKSNKKIRLKEIK
jgi:hypothetical protein